MGGGYGEGVWGGGEGGEGRAGEGGGGGWDGDGDGDGDGGGVGYKGGEGVMLCYDRWVGYVCISTSITRHVHPPVEEAL